MNITIERKKTDCNALPKGWQREEVLRKTGLSAGKVDVYYYSSRGIRTDVSLVPPIRQTASIFKQPVTVHRNHDSKVKNDLKHGTSQEKPKQLFWEKRLEGLHACDMDGNDFGPIELPRGLKPVGPHVDNGTLLQSVTTALHLNSTIAITGQTAPKSALTSNAGVFLNPEQPLMHAVTIHDDDIRRQEDRVTNARKKLQDALKC
ncbi:methyl-CpG-binding domain protein 2 isoform X2 [Sitodiplosis mosellana]|uniref:methyl-CpG-binding domain protein 2 isoform X2 n=1 Tax=Sitodiplosis mosellana TaxID=263140 RepID=UPI002444A747|nr:methyl-CpG-binding domain protein 2 isoform X2 [Sitodiplosis mosellana]